MNAITNIWDLIILIILFPLAIVLGIIKLIIITISYLYKFPDSEWIITTKISDFVGEIAWFDFND